MSFSRPQNVAVAWQTPEPLESSVKTRHLAHHEHGAETLNAVLFAVAEGHEIFVRQRAELAGVIFQRRR